MRSMYFAKRGDKCAGYWRCGICRADRPHMTPGVHVMVGNNLLAIVCLGDCHSKVSADIVDIAPHSFPDLDADGVLLEGASVG